LTGKLIAIARERPDRQIFVRADEKVEYGEVIRTMAAIKASGIQNVGMVTGMPSAADESTGTESSARATSKP
ncbi:MAG: ExbD/TolR family protein, partial [Candidatus Binataceae bacterium]